VAAEAAIDAMLAHSVRGALGRRRRGTPRINVGPCTFVVALLHGTVLNAEERDHLEAAARAVPGVRGVVNKLGVIQG
jgi:osmotically-inducible protein OsmY